MNAVKYTFLLSFSLLVGEICGQNSLQFGVDYFPNISVASSGDGLKVGNSLGIFMKKQITDKVWLSSGLNYANTGHENGSGPFRWGTQHDGNGGFDPNLPAEGEFFNNFNHLELPLKIEGALAKGKHSFYLSIGSMFRVLLNDKQGYRISSHTEERIEVALDDGVNYQKISLAFQGGVGWRKAIKSKWFFFLEPRLQANPVRGELNDERVKGQYFLYGISLGFGMGRND